jgi:uroporphyrinogen decarboxylase
LHSCGNLAEIMPDLIDDVGIDAKHSYENAILPVDEFQARYGAHIGVLGGVDVDILARRSPDEVRAEVRRIIEACHPRGRFGIGSGNSIPSYIPVANYLAMLDEALR